MKEWVETEQAGVVDIFQGRLIIEATKNMMASLMGILYLSNPSCCSSGLMFNPFLNKTSFSFRCSLASSDLIYKVRVDRLES